MGGLLTLRSHWFPLRLCRGDVSPRRPCSAEWTGQPVGFTPKQLGTARHGQTASPGLETGAESLRWRSFRAGGAPSTPEFLIFCFSPRHRTEGEWCAHGAAGVCACVCFPVWITMMQSAAVLPTESPVKSLPEILGVPLQRKTIFRTPQSIFDVLQDSCVGPWGGGGWSVGRGDEDKPRRLSRTGQ